MALESVDYSEEKAIKILEIVMQDDRNTRSEPKQEVKEVASAENEAAPEAQSELSKSDRYFAELGCVIAVLLVEKACAPALHVSASHFS